MPVSKAHSEGGSKSDPVSAPIRAAAIWRRSVLTGAMMAGVVMAGALAPAGAATQLPLPRPVADAAADPAPELTAEARQRIVQSALLGKTIAAAKAGRRGEALDLAARHGDPALEAAADWIALRAIEPRFETIAAFERVHPDWPDARLGALAERDLYRRKPDAATVIAAFETALPRTEAGRRAYARALISDGRLDEARTQIAQLYREARLSAEDESGFLKVYGAALKAEDHADRATYQLYFERVTAAERAIERAPEHAVGQRRVAVCGAVIRKRALPALTDADRADPHIAYCLAESGLTKSATPLTAAHHLARVTGTGDAIGPRSRWSQRREVAREMLDAGQTTLAYEVAAHHGITAPAQASEAEAMAGWIALRGLGEPDRAEPHFRRVAELTTRPISQARAAYWLGRTHDARDEMVSAVRAYRAAAAHPTTYYGQLAHDRLGQRTLSLPALPVSDAADRHAFDQRLVVRAAHLLAGAGETGLATTLAAGLANAAPDPVTAKLAARLVTAFGTAKSQVGVGKRASYRGLALDAYAFPTLDVISAEAETDGVGAAVLHGIARQESLFDATAGSHVGAKGLMQLMPATAREVSGQLGLRYTSNRLTQDPTYNVKLGSAYLAGLDRRFSGAMPMMFAGYNAGPGRVNQWVRRYGDPRDSVEIAVDWIERIPFEETRNYVMRVMENVAVYRARLEGGAAELRIVDDLLGRKRDFAAMAGARRTERTSRVLQAVSGPAQAFTGVPPLPRERLHALGGPAARLVDGAISKD